MNENKKMSLRYNDENNTDIELITNIIDFSSDLIEINKLRYKNFILFRTETMQLEFNVDRKEFFITH